MLETLPPELHVIRSYHQIKEFPHSHTLENRSSLAPNPPPLFAGAALAAGVTGTALLQPPKSSSALTLGGEDAVLNPPPPLETIL